MERKIGFSTGALAFGDFERGVALQRIAGVDAIELSALREHELEGAIEALHLLDNPQFVYRSFHAPSHLETLDDAALVDKLKPVFDKNIPVIVHPDVIQNYVPWRQFGNLVLIENMDRRKTVGRTSAELISIFKKLPEARLCFDIGHVRQIDPSMGVGLQMLLRFKERLAEVHISEVNWDCKHIAISTAAALGFQKLAGKIAKEVPIIIESVVKPEQIEDELIMVKRCLNTTCKLLGGREPING